MTNSLLVVLLVLAAGSAVQSYHQPDGRQSLFDTADHCLAALAPTAAERLRINAALVNCIAEQDGLAAIINVVIKSPRSQKHLGVLKLPFDTATALVNAGDATKAALLWDCIAKMTGFLKVDGSFDQGKLEATIRLRVAGLTINSNTELGLTNCPKVTGFDVFAYIHCILAYCSTGAAP